MIRIPGTCSMCIHHREGDCFAPDSRFSSQRMWRLACVACDGYRDVRKEPAKAAE